jgi:hypothetical protein
MIGTKRLIKCVPKMCCYGNQVTVNNPSGEW